jgi:hypothetical protein
MKKLGYLLFFGLLLFWVSMQFDTAAESIVVTLIVVAGIFTLWFIVAWIYGLMILFHTNPLIGCAGLLFPMIPICVGMLASLGCNMGQRK